MATTSPKILFALLLAHAKPKNISIGKRDEKPEPEPFDSVRNLTLYVYQCIDFPTFARSDAFWVCRDFAGAPHLQLTKRSLKEGMFETDPPC